MKKIKFLKFISHALMLTLMGCASAMINQPGIVSNQYAPSNEASRPGTIKYLNQGADFIIKMRREDAYKKMYNACNSKYKILSEGPNSEGGVVSTAGNSAVFSTTEYWYITFQCE